MEEKKYTEDGFIADSIDVFFCFIFDDCVGISNEKFGEFNVLLHSQT